MKLITLIIGLAAAAVASSAADAFPPHVVANSEVRDLPTSAHGRNYQLHIGLPASYAKNPDKKYPVVYVTDGYWDFEKMSAMEGSLTYDKLVPEFITVGIGYTGKDLNYGELRTWELSPVALGGPNSGHAEQYLDSIKKEIIPFIEREYRADPSHRVLAGASLGGLFTLYTLFSEPDLFSGYIAATPAVVVGNDWLLNYEEKFAEGRNPIAARVFVAGGGNESPGFLGGILRLNQRFAQRKYLGDNYCFHIVEGARHAGMQHEAYVRGLTFVFAPLAPEHGPSSSP